jgi:hypothetical protein
MTTIAICLGCSFACLLWLTFEAWRSPIHVGAKKSTLPDVPVRGSILDLEA